jgi:hypothetical protein
VGVVIVFEIGQHNVAISGLTMADATAFDVLNLGNLHLTDCAISHTPGALGRGLFNDGGTLTVTHCSIRDSTVAGSTVQGGGIYNSGTLILDGSTVDNNTVIAIGTADTIGGGGIYNSTTGIMQATDSTFSNNKASGNPITFGGAIFNDGVLNLTRCAVVHNISQGVIGGGIFNSGRGTVTLTNCTLDDNHASFSGGALFNEKLVTMTNCTVADNTETGAGGQGGGLYNVTGATLNLLNTLVARNAASTGPDVFGPIAGTSLNNLIGNGDGSTGLANGVGGNQVGTTVSPINPGLSVLQNNGGPTQTVALLAGSPAINRGTNTGAPTEDQRSFNRPVDGTTDIGAYEYQPPATTTTLRFGAPPTPCSRFHFPFNTLRVLAGRALSFTATVCGGARGSNTPAGTVTFSDNGVTPVGWGPITLQNGVAALSNVMLSAGRHTITAAYTPAPPVGDFRFDASMGSLPVVARSGAYFAVGGAPGQVQVRSTSNGALLYAFTPYPGYTGRVNVAVGDVTFDGFEELVTAPADGNPQVKVYDGAALVNRSFDPTNPDASLLAQWFAYGLNFNIGANVAVGDINDTGFADIVTGASAGNPDIRVYSGRDIANHTFNPDGASLLAQWFAYGLNFNVGANVAVGDISGTGFADVVTGATVGNPDVRVYRGQDIARGAFNPTGASLLAQWFPFQLQFNVGAFVAVGDVTGDGFADVITGASVGNPEVKVYNGRAIAQGPFDPNTNVLDDFFAYDVGQDLGVTVGAADFERNDRWDILTGPTGGTATFQVIRHPAFGTGPTSVFAGMATGIQGGLTVGA